MKVKSEGVVGFEDDGGESSFGFDSVPKKKKNKTGGFQGMGFSGSVMKGLQKRGYKLPTPIQRKSIPIILEGRDLVAMARTGSGKTACFLLPMFEKLVKPTAGKVDGIRALILSPTRELALQTLRFIRELGRYTGLRAIAVLGGDSMDTQFGALHNHPDIVVATPGRFLHLCVEMDLKLTSVEYVVFDEADRLFEMGFGEQLTEILNRLSDNRQTVLFSATLPKLLVQFARAGLSDPVLIRLDVENKLPDTLELAFLSVRSEDKPAALLCVLQALPLTAQTLVFLATKHHVEYVHMMLDQAGISNTFIYSDLDASARKINAAKFQNGNVSVLLVTDVAARGVDIPQLDYVINYHFPAKAKLFVHRVGRCARAGRTGTAFSLVSAEEAPFVVDLHLFLGRPLNLVPPAGGEASDQSCAFGKIPQAAVEAEQSRVMAWHHNIAELVSMQKSCNNGYKKYLKSRPGASAESVKRVKELDLASLGALQLFKKVDLEGDSARQLLDQMKNYKPKGTIFELNVSAKAKSYSVMKTTKKAHERLIENFKQKQALRNEANVPGNRKACQLPAETDEAEISNTFDKIILGKRRHEGDGVKKKKKKKVDQEHYVPHVAPDRHTEDGLSVNTFTSEASKVAFDLTEDTAEGINLARKLMKWDKKKKKMVGVESAKAGKIRTESGVWISKSYKSSRYADWKEKSKVDAAEDDSDPDEESNPQTPRFKNQKKDFPNTHWGRHNRKVAAKDKSRAGLKKPEQIMKARTQLRRKQQRSLPKKTRQGSESKGGKGGRKGGKRS